MTKFTDDDMLKLKGLLEMGAISITVEPNKIPALIKRLEESEKLNEAFINGFQDAVEFRLKTWRKSKGELK
jgi:hypothetical protein